MQEYFQKVFDWMSQPESYFGPGPLWIGIGLILAGFTFLQAFSDDWAGGKLFSRKALFITLSLDAAWISLIFVAPNVPTWVTIPIIGVVACIILAILARKKWR